MNTPWSSDEVQMLGRCIDLGLSGGTAKLSLRGRSRSAVIGKARTLGWRFGKPRDPESLVPRTPREPGPKTRSSDTRALCVLFDLDTLGEIERRSKAERISKSQVVRELVEWGLEA